jgi:hypothetical protein
LVGIGLTDLQNVGGPLAPGLSVPASLQHSKDKFDYLPDSCVCHRP